MLYSFKTMYEIDNYYMFSLGVYYDTYAFYRIYNDKFCLSKLCKGSIRPLYKWRAFLLNTNFILKNNRSAKKYVNQNESYTKQNLCISFTKWNKICV